MYYLSMEKPLSLIIASKTSKIVEKAKIQIQN
jgi:hypothetical protein